MPLNRPLPVPPPPSPFVLGVWVSFALTFAFRFCMCVTFRVAFSAVFVRLTSLSRTPSRSVHVAAMQRFRLAGGRAGFPWLCPAPCVPVHSLTADAEVASTSWLP